MLISLRLNTVISLRLNTVCYELQLREYTASIIQEDGTDKDEVVNEATNLLKVESDFPCDMLIICLLLLCTCNAFASVLSVLSVLSLC